MQKKFVQTSNGISLDQKKTFLKKLQEAGFKNAKINNTQPAKKELHDKELLIIK
ncbi:hypothetical protein [Exiguobacterium sp. s16]|uniref:hypothetical protein n=1 Tax=Exiguobacterium sp. s16 TaxID=2751237 RepID=UPI001BE5E397|nr:hypothetical protein [Exiguobacterium sp. s16]